MWMAVALVGFSLLLSLSVFPHDISKNNAARVTVLHIEMLNNESWKPIYFWVKRSWS